MGKKPWVTVADEIQLGCAQSSNPEEELQEKVFAS